MYLRWTKKRRRRIHLDLKETEVYDDLRAGQDAGRATVVCRPIPRYVLEQGATCRARLKIDNVAQVLVLSPGMQSPQPTWFEPKYGVVPSRTAPHSSICKEIIRVEPAYAATRG